MLTIPKQYKSLKFIKLISWSDIFAEWCWSEAWQESWKKHWKERGYSSWEEWRQRYAAPLKPEKLEWFLYEITDPLESFPNFLGVPSKSWIKKAYGGQTSKRLKDILSLPIIKDNDKIIDIKKKFPASTMFTGIVAKNDIIIIEGMHRACALASWDKSKTLNSKIGIALADWTQKEIPVIGSGYKNNRCL